MFSFDQYTIFFCQLKPTANLEKATAKLFHSSISSRINVPCWISTVSLLTFSEEAFWSLILLFFAQIVFKYLGESHTYIQWDHCIMAIIFLPFKLTF